ncbi:hypothetical protein HanRHA438_Chr06g0283171 [Helianthus annuus]|uniref:Uncharacterized protein n=1 Tax=Helianthus annuus TaxID=4232 RepID=A0A9K3IVT0_HELAN|nr:hypothetical protein HanXRQr2_Chr06g0274111 [Helianthus annuus]KAJ0561589.1 hypothetical protein HanHA300_Chr06g0224691 [Helianthus annuus]KAJ0568304.1 hypothetical protein HanIR_Chr06g0294681 [Helianthus annuus]KAJ0574654.1 hypothetical protein HanHA89_Chr06g0240651 [Helianthus annuus]KAJ0738984.1 hypothetical protein HanLR1_Chr06g0224551 [Helianthus annuus]
MDPSKSITKLRKMENGNNIHYRLQQKHEDYYIEDYDLEVLYQLGCFCVLEKSYIYFICSHVLSYLKNIFSKNCEFIQICKFFGMVCLKLI